MNHPGLIRSQPKFQPSTAQAWTLNSEPGASPIGCGPTSPSTPTRGALGRRLGKLLEDQLGAGDREVLMDDGSLRWPSASSHALAVLERAADGRSCQRGLGRDAGRLG